MHYFTHALNREVKEIYWHATLSNLAMALTTVFEPIFLFSQGYTLTQILFYFVMIYSLFAVLIFWGAKVAGKIGYKHAIFWSGVFYIVYWIGLYQITNFWWLFYIIPIFLAIQKSLLWPAYDADVALNFSKRQEGRETGFLFSLIQIAIVIGPILGGILSFFFGFKVLFGTAAFLMLFAAYPLFLSDEVFSQHSFRFRDFWQVVKRYGRNFFGYWGFAEDLMLQSIWPISVFLIVPNFFNIGFITTVASFIAIMLMLYVGKLSDKTDRRKLTQVASVIYGLIWPLRFFVGSFAGVFAFDTAVRIGKSITTVPMMSQTYDLAGGSTPDHAIAYSVFYEFSLSVGKIFTALMGMWILSATGNINYIFILAGTLTMFYGLLRK